MQITFSYCASLLLGSALLSATNIVYSQSPAPSGNRISDHFGFDGVDAIKVDKGGGPLTTADLDGDGKSDLIAINNRNSRIDLLYQKVGAKPTDEVPPTSSINEIPQHWRFRRVEVPVSDAVGTVLPFDFDGDKRMDLIYSAGSGKIVFMRQSSQVFLKSSESTRLRISIQIETH